MRTSPGWSGIAASYRMIFEIAEMAGECHMLRPRNILIAKEQHLVLQEQRTNFGQQDRGPAMRRQD